MVLFLDYEAREGRGLILRRVEGVLEFDGGGCFFTVVLCLRFCGRQLTEFFVIRAVVEVFGTIKMPLNAGANRGIYSGEAGISLPIHHSGFRG